MAQGSTALSPVCATSAACLESRRLSTSRGRCAPEMQQVVVIEERQDVLALQLRVPERTLEEAEDHESGEQEETDASREREDWRGQLLKDG